jgi:hypothetical protein
MFDQSSYITDISSSLKSRDPNKKTNSHKLTSDLPFLKENKPRHHP